MALICRLLSSPILFIAWDSFSPAIYCRAKIPTKDPGTRGSNLAIIVFNQIIVPSLGYVVFSQRNLTG
ncbi:MAG: hypothetical protein L3J69_10170 [Desulfobacula sp.]|nr:hypothetical protein [Desulfobacula sp.]